jgi:hypothetical protein
MPTKRRQELIKIWHKGRLSIKGDKEALLLKNYNVTL